MFPEDCHCSGNIGRHAHTILFNILSRTDSSDTGEDQWEQYLAPHSCHCEQRRLVCLRNPGSTCQSASGVLVKTIRFMKSLPSFHHLPYADQLLLLQGGWVQLFVLGLAQEHVDFEVTDVPSKSILRKILLNDPGEHDCGEAKGLPTTLARVHKLKSCLHKLWALDLSPKEYAYLKGALLFNPDIPGLTSSTVIEGLQREAQRVLHEVVLSLYPEDGGRFTRVLLTVSSLQTVAHSLITELFFRPIIGQTDLGELMNEMLFNK